MWHWEPGATYSAGSKALGNSGTGKGGDNGEGLHREGGRGGGGGWRGDVGAEAGWDKGYR